MAKSASMPQMVQQAVANRPSGGGKSASTPPMQGQDGQREAAAQLVQSLRSRNDAMASPSTPARPGKGQAQPSPNPMAQTAQPRPGKSMGQPQSWNASSVSANPAAYAQYKAGLMPARQPPALPPQASQQAVAAQQAQAQQAAAQQAALARQAQAQPQYNYSDTWERPGGA
jgi:hypothetical protein